MAHPPRAAPGGATPRGATPRGGTPRAARTSPPRSRRAAHPCSPGSPGSRRDRRELTPSRGGATVRVLSGGMAICFQGGKARRRLRIIATPFSAAGLSAFSFSVAVLAVLFAAPCAPARAAVIERTGADWTLAAPAGGAIPAGGATSAGDAIPAGGTAPAGDAIPATPAGRATICCGPGRSRQVARSCRACRGRSH